MSNNPTVPLVPEDPDDDLSSEAPVQEVNGQEVLDPDADDDLIDSADADRLATGADEG